MNYIEKVGTGIQRIKKSIAELGRGKVNFSYDEHWFIVTFTRTKTNSKRIQSSVIKSNQRVTSRQQDILNLFTGQTQLTSDEICKKLDGQYINRFIRMELVTLKELNFLDYIGATRGRKWFRTK